MLRALTVWAAHRHGCVGCAPGNGAVAACRSKGVRTGRESDAWQPSGARAVGPRDAPGRMRHSLGDVVGRRRVVSRPSTYYPGRPRPLFGHTPGMDRPVPVRRPADNGTSQNALGGMKDQPPGCGRDVGSVASTQDAARDGRSTNAIAPGCEDPARPCSRAHVRKREMRSTYAR